MTQTTQVSLSIFGGLADPDSNILRLLIKSNGLNTSVQTKVGRFTFAKNLPVLQDGHSTKNSLSDIINHILTSARKDPGGTEMYAYRSCFEQKLYNITLMHNWYNELNAAHTVTCYKEHIHALVASVFTIRTRKQKTMEIENLITYNSIEDPLRWVRNEALECFLDLDSILGNKKYLLGSSPSVLDAIVVGNLSTILYLEHPDSTIRDILNGHERLCVYIRRFNKQFGDGIAEQENSRFKHVKTVVEKDTNDGKADWPTVIAAGTFAAFAMGSYAYSKGLFRYH